MAVFPSVAWFEAVRKIYNGDDKYHGGGAGACNCVMAIKSGSNVIQLVFEGRDCTQALEIASPDAADLDFYLEMEPSAWRAMVENIKENGHASLDQTLNTLDLDAETSICKGADQYRADLFFRYNQTFQNFFDASSRIDTTFA